MKMRTALAALAIVASVASAQATRSLTAKSGARVVYDADARREIVAMREEVGELRDSDAGPSVRVFGDGRILVHYPKYMKLGGDYEAKLAPEEVDDLVRAVVDGGVTEFDPVATKQQRVAAQRAKRAVTNAVYEESDPSVTEIAIDLFEVQAPSSSGAKRAAGRVQRRVRWPALSRDARQFPDLAAVQGLNDVRTRLGALMERGDLVRSGD